MLSGEERAIDVFAGDDATSVADAGSTWPDFLDGMPARPSLVVITKPDTGVVGS